MPAEQECGFLPAPTWDTSSRSAGAWARSSIIVSFVSRLESGSFAVMIWVVPSGRSTMWLEGTMLILTVRLPELDWLQLFPGTYSRTAAKSAHLKTAAIRRSGGTRFMCLVVGGSVVNAHDTPPTQGTSAVFGGALGLGAK